ncbi:MAG: hypothetical protein WD708_11010 [Kiritimatiellia bacterium]
MRNEPPALYIDTVTLSNFLGADEGPLLVTQYGSRLTITAEVYTELSAGAVTAGVNLEPLARDLDAGRVSFAPPSNAAMMRRQQMYRRSLGAGEASCMAHAAISGGVVATDDRAARRLCGEEGIPVTGTIGILVVCVRKGSLSLSRAEDLHATMVKNGFYSPVVRIGDCLRPG